LVKERKKIKQYTEKLDSLNNNKKSNEEEKK
jgi:hypothetical protein